MKTYRTAELAKMIAIHPNTVRLYEQWGLISKPERQANGYRVYTELHLEQLRLARTAFQTEVLQNGLRQKMVQTLKLVALCDFDGALAMAANYAAQIRRELEAAREAADFAARMLVGKCAGEAAEMKRSEVCTHLDISFDTLRNWERNGLLGPPLRCNGYRLYSAEDVGRLNIIKALRCANYSLEAILRLLNRVAKDPDTDISAVLDTPGEQEQLVSACDRLVSSLQQAEHNARKLAASLRHMKHKFHNPPL